MHTSNHTSFRMSVGVLFSSYTALGLVTAMLGPSLPALASQTRTTLASVGLVFVARYLGYIIGAGGLGRLFDRIRGGVLLAGAVAGMGVFTLLLPIPSTLTLLFVIVLLLGIAQGIADVGGNVLILRVTGDNSRPFVHGLHLFFGIGSIAAPVLIGLSLSRNGTIHGAYWLIGIVMIPIALVLLQQVGTAVPQHAISQKSRRKHNAFIFGLAFFYFLYIGAEASMGGWIYSYAIQQPTLVPEVAALMTSLFWLAITIGRLGVIPISKHVEPTPLLLSALLLASVSLTAIFLLKKNEGVLVFGIFLSGLFMAIVFPGMLNFANQAVSITGSRAATLMIGSNAGAMIIPFLIGRLMSDYSEHMLLVSVLSVLLLSLITLIVLIYWKRHHLSETIAPNR